MADQRHNILPEAMVGKDIPAAATLQSSSGASNWLWTCDNCFEQGGMTVTIEQCPGCYHHRCDYCPVELTNGLREIYRLKHSVSEYSTHSPVEIFEYVLCLPNNNTLQIQLTGQKFDCSG